MVANSRLRKHPLFLHLLASQRDEESMKIGGVVKELIISYLQEGWLRGRDLNPRPLGYELVGTQRFTDGVPA